MSESIEPPPEGLGPDDLAAQLLLHMGVGRTQANMVAASDALRIKAMQPKVTVPMAYMHIYEMWQEYKASPRYRSEFRRKAADWLSEADYDNPESWGGRQLPKAFAAKANANSVDSIAEWKRDKQLHPENYCTAEETKEFLRQMHEVLERKRMPDSATSAQLRQRTGSNSTTVGSQDALTEAQNNGLLK